MSYTESNDASRARLEAFVRGLTDEALRRPAPYVTVLLQRWQAGGVDESPVDPDMINDALVPFWAALEPRAAAELCLQAAAEADAEVAALSPELTAAVEQAMAEGKVFMRLDRSLHRLGHLADLEPIIRGS
jgi:hypothetical protein